MEGKELASFMKANPMFTVHDAAFLPPKIAAIMEKHYRQNTMEVSYQYDVANEMVIQARARAAAIIKRDDKTVTPDELLGPNFVKTATEVEANFAARQKLMDEKYREADGSWKVIDGFFGDDIKTELEGADEKYKERKTRAEAKVSETSTGRSKSKTERTETKSTDGRIVSKPSKYAKEVLSEAETAYNEGRVLTYDTETDKNGNMFQIGYTNGAGVEGNYMVNPFTKANEQSGLGQY